eukprot:scaffold62839_cov18-Tisochrysis_lutea.AAC.2
MMPLSVQYLTGGQMQGRPNLAASGGEQVQGRPNVAARSVKLSVQKEQKHVVLVLVQHLKWGSDDDDAGAVIDGWPDAGRARLGCQDSQALHEGSAQPNDTVGGAVIGRGQMQGTPELALSLSRPFSKEAFKQVMPVWLDVPLKTGGRARIGQTWVLGHLASRASQLKERMHMRRTFVWTIQSSSVYSVCAKEWVWGKKAGKMAGKMGSSGSCLQACLTSSSGWVIHQEHDLEVLGGWGGV